MMIEIYGTTNCGFCKDAVTLCEAAKLDYKYTALDVYPDALEALEERIGRIQTVPQIFIDGEHVGGFTELKEAMKNG